MRQFPAIRYIVKGNPSQRNDYPYCVVYMTQRHIGLRFHFRHVSVINEWNGAADLNMLDRSKVYNNRQDKKDPFILFARSSEYQR